MNDYVAEAQTGYLVRQQNGNTKHIHLTVGGVVVMVCIIILFVWRIIEFEIKNTAPTCACGYYIGEHSHRRLPTDLAQHSRMMQQQMEIPNHNVEGAVVVVCTILNV